jgi:hypothetical protein
MLAFSDCQIVAGIAHAEKDLELFRSLSTAWMNSENQKRRRGKKYYFSQRAKSLHDKPPKIFSGSIFCFFAVFGINTRALGLQINIRNVAYRLT